MAKYIIVLLVSTFWLQSIFAKGLASNSTTPLELDYLSQENFLVGISRIGVNLSNSSKTQCESELQIFLESIAEKELWALKLIDAFGVTPKSFHWGNYFWFSTKDMCDDLNDPFTISLSESYHPTNYLNTTSPFTVRFWMIYFNFTTPVYVDMKGEFKHHIHVGLCLPQSCSQEDAVHYSQVYFGEKSFRLQQQFDVEMDVVAAKSPELKLYFLHNTGMYLLVLYLVLIFILNIAASQINKKHSKLSKDLQNKYSLMEQFILCFDIKSNLQRMFSFEKALYPVLDGIRACICLWVTVAHVYYYAFIIMTNPLLMLAKLEYFLFQPLLQGTYFVDTFFIISSFLFVHNFLSNTDAMKKIKTNKLTSNMKLFFRLVLSRYVRLLPIVLVTMVFINTLYDFLDMYSPLHMDQNSPVYCKETWWHNILFVNNFLKFDRICSSWTWYLGCDMQYFIIFALILFVSARNESLGKCILTCVLVGGIVTTFLSYYFFGFTFQPDVTALSTEELYSKPWNRINCYTGGAIAGWLFVKIKENSIELNLFWRTAFWMFTSCFFLVLAFISYWKTCPVWVTALLMSLGKVIFALCMGGVFILCILGHGGKLNYLLTRKPLLIMNAVGFSVYLMAPVIIVAVHASQLEAIFFNEINSTLNVISITILSIVVAFVLTLLVETPSDKIRIKFITKRTTNTVKAEKPNDVSTKED